MSTVLENGRHLTAKHEGLYIRFDGFNRRLGTCDPHKSDCHRLHRVWHDGINIKKHGTPQFIRPSFVPAHKLNQRVEVFTLDEFEKLPE